MDNNNSREQFMFTGKGSSLFVLYLKNIFLSIITLGIYSFWARVNITRYLYRNTMFMETSFDYHATGLERFLGFLKALGIVILFIIGMVIFQVILMKLLGQEAASVIIAIIIYLSILGAVPFIMVGAERYRLSRSSWRAIRFRFSGSTGECAGLFYFNIFLLIITIGLYMPWYYCAVRSYFLNHSHYGSEPIRYTGKGKELAKTYYIGLLLSIVTVGVYSFWLGADLERYDREHTFIQDRGFHTDITGSLLFKTTVLGFLLIIITLGFAFPWFMVMFMRMYINTLSIDQGLDLQLITAGPDAKGSALADGLADAASAADSVGSFFG